MSEPRIFHTSTGYGGVVQTTVEHEGQQYTWDGWRLKLLTERVDVIEKILRELGCENLPIVSNT